MYVHLLRCVQAQQQRMDGPPSRTSKAKQKRLERKAARLMRRRKGLDLCFLIDCTGSMVRVLKRIINLQQFPNLTLLTFRFASTLTFSVNGMALTSASLVIAWHIMFAPIFHVFYSIIYKLYRQNSRPLHEIDGADMQGRTCSLPSKALPAPFAYRRPLHWARIAAIADRICCWPLCSDSGNLSIWSLHAG